MQQTLDVSTAAEVGVYDVTDEVEETIPDSVDSGLCSVFVPHTTAGITVNEAESNLLEDVETLLRSIAPTGDGYRHDRIDDNADAHLRSMLLGSSVTVPVRAGSLELGTWQSILLFEGDGPRTRSLRVTVLEE